MTASYYYTAATGGLAVTTTMMATSNYYTTAAAPLSVLQHCCYCCYCCENRNLTLALVSMQVTTACSKQSFECKMHI
eukprot:18729-Heterococcus_DN1.PRE.2